MAIEPPSASAPAQPGPAPAPRADGGVLYLLPTPLGNDDDPRRVLPAATTERITHVDYVIAEHARSARSVIARLPMRSALQAIEVRELNRHTPPDALPQLLAPIVAGRDGALLSEAGCPAVADPGAALVALAHARGLRVVPLIGPSSLLLALMASGMNGQRFAFVGYVPVAQAERASCLRELERRSARDQETQILIETPYRNQALFDAMLATLAPDTLLSIASELTLPGESVRTRRIADWRKLRIELPRAPTVFSLLAAHAPLGTKSRAGEAGDGARAARVRATGREPRRDRGARRS